MLGDQVEYFFRDADQPNKKWGGWIGKYTIGHIGCRGTRLYFRPNAAKSFDSDPGYEFDKEDFCKAMETVDETKDTFLGDYCNIRCESLLDILLYLHYGCNELGMFSGTVSEFYDFLVEINLPLAELIKNEKIDRITTILYDLCPTRKAWFIYDFDNVNEELKKALEVCNKNNVKWEWI
jgi:hypothetical protein